jgi:hypothetical protein
MVHPVTSNVFLGCQGRNLIDHLFQWSNQERNIQ